MVKSPSTYRLSDEAKELLRSAAEQYGVSQADILEMMIRGWLGEDSQIDKEEITNLSGNQARIALLAMAEGKTLRGAIRIAQSYPE